MLKPLGLICAAVFLCATPAHAALLTLDMNFEFSGGTAPTGGTPWLRATFDDSVGGSNTVRLTMENIGLVGTESTRNWHFNLDPNLDPTLLSFFGFDTVDAVPLGIDTGLNAYMADGDGSFDIRFRFAMVSGAPNDFTAGESIVYDITYVSPISVSSFDYQSVPGPGMNSGPFRSAAQIQNINGVGVNSGWIGDGASAPEPSAWLLLAAGLLALRLRRS